MELTSQQEQIILGSLLGDAGINKDKRYEGYEFAERHSLKQTSYLAWKNGYLYFNFKIYKENNLCTLRKNNKTFKKYRELFYPNGKKIVTKEILEKLTPLSIAIWYMDDGDYVYKSDSMRLATHSFKLEGNKIIRDWFKEKLDIGVKIRRAYDKRKKKEYFYIELNNNNGKKLISIIKDHIIDSMTYKIGLDNERREKAKAKKREYNKRWWKNNEDKRKAYYQKWKRLYYEDHKRGKKNKKNEIEG